MTTSERTIKGADGKGQLSKVGRQLLVLTGLARHRRKPGESADVRNEMCRQMRRNFGWGKGTISSDRNTVESYGPETSPDPPQTGVLHAGKTSLV